MIEQYLSNTIESDTVRKILTFRGLNKAQIKKENKNSVRLIPGVAAAAPAMWRRASAEPDLTDPFHGPSWPLVCWFVALR
jgi:hypothetical protein